MKALILAAGMGTRLVPVSANIPKAMVPVNGKPILVKQIENLIDNDVTDIAVVVGYKGEVIKELVNQRFSFVHIIESPNYATTNNMYSAYLAKEWVGHSPFIMMNGDVFFDSVIIKDLCDNEVNDLICTDVGQYMEESMKVVEQNGRLTEISKDIPRELALGVSIDVYKFSEQSGGSFFEKCFEYIHGKREVNLWSEVALNDTLKVHRFLPCHIRGRWFEIDTLEDLASAEQLFAID